MIIFALAMTTGNTLDQQWISRCFALARRGIGNVSPNPPVGAMLVHQGKILSEGYHIGFGGPHAEVEAIRAVKEDERHLIPASVLYVSLEPCCITNKTPPCTDLIIREGIRDVRISTHDPNPDISGKGIQMLQAQGIHVQYGILEDEGKELIRAFKINILERRPYIILKWAQSIHGYMGGHEKIWLSHPYTNAWTHSQRASADAILAGARTIMMDNPFLTTRDAPGKSPHRVIYDPNGILSDQYHVFDDDGRRVYYFSVKPNLNLKSEHIVRHVLSKENFEVEQILKILYADNVGILLVEGGSYLLNLFIQHKLWDEAWVIKTKHPLGTGIEAPVVRGELIQEIEYATDMITGIRNDQRQ